MSDRTKILLFASNPVDMNQLSLDEEVRDIRRKIRSSDYRDVLDLITRSAVRPDDLQQELLEQRPAVVHFSGHGSTSGKLVLMDDAGQAKPVEPAALTALFSTFKDDIKLVFLNACYTRLQGAAIAEVIDCVVGMSAPVSDKAAITFAASFYRAIGFACSVKQAFDLGKGSLKLEGVHEDTIPELLHQPMVDPSSIYLVSEPQSKMDIVGVNLEVARAILSLMPAIVEKKPDRSRKEAVAGYYQKIADNLKETVALLRTDVYPHGCCEKILIYGQDLPKAIGDLIGMDKAKVLSEKLMGAYQVEGLHKQLKDIADKEGSLADLEKAAAYFEVSADSLLASQ